MDLLPTTEPAQRLSALVKGRPADRNTARLVERAVEDAFVHRRTDQERPV
ncbi:hypothetical protein [Streptomyces sp. 769]|nr:hypothetical protein [Streptomyces sp. 769]